MAAQPALAGSLNDDLVDKEFPFDQRDFERARALIYREAGIALPDSKQSLVYSRLSRRLRARGIGSFKVYLDMLEASPAQSSEWQEFTNALTTNLTSFFREEHHFKILTDQLRQLGSAGTVNIWCCAASTGEEPYSLAMTALEAFGSARPPVKILATDIDTQVLATAQTGVYSLASVKKLDTSLLKKHFLRGSGVHADKVRVRPELGALIEFRPLNLLHKSWKMDTRFQVIFCRNVMIYFDRDTQHQVLRQLAQHITPNGRLYAGHSENFSFARDVFELQGQTVYRPSAAAAR